MPIVVNTNSAATTASFNLGRSNEALRKSLGRLSSGKRITSPAQVVDLLQSNLTNLEAAHGRIMDADIALESTKFARQNVLVQAGTINDRTGEPTYQRSTDLPRIVPNSTYI